MTLALAIVGTVTGCLALIVDLLRYRRERPRLIVTTNVSAHVAGPARVTLDVANRGAAATTIVKAALQDQGEVQISDHNTGQVVTTGRIETQLSPGALTVISPGGAARFQLDLDGWPDMVSIDAVTRAYVIDSHGRTTWGAPFPMMRMAFPRGAYRPPLGGVNPDLLRSPGGVITPPALERRWKVWKPKDLRNPEPFPEYPPIDLTA